MMTIGAINRAPAAVTGLVNAVAEKTDGFKAQGAPDTVPANDTATPEAAATTGHGSLLLPSTATDLMKLVNDTPAQELGSTALSQHDWLVRNMKTSAASTDPTLKAGESNYYSQNDLDTIKAATGYNLVVLNGGTAIVDDQGNPPPPEITQQVSRLAAAIEGDRSAGVFKGEVTPDYLQDVFARFADAKQALPDDWLKKAIDYLGQGQTAVAAAAQAPQVAE